MAERELRWRDRLGVRLAAAFTVTAMAAVAALTGLALTATSSGVGVLAAEHRARTVDDVVAALEGAYLAAGGWAEADLLPAHTLAAAAGAVLIVDAPGLGELPVPPGITGPQRQLREGARTEPRVAPGSKTDDRPPDGPPVRDSSGQVGRAPSPPAATPETDAGAPSAPDTDAGSPTAPGTDARAPTEPDGEPEPEERSGPARHGDAPTEGSGPSGTGGESDPAPRTRSGALSGSQPPTLGDITLASSPRSDRPVHLVADRTTDDLLARAEAPVVVGGQVVGIATLLFVASDLPDPTQAFQEQLGRSLVVGAVVAALLALASTVFVTSRLTRPLRQLTADVERIAHGEPTDRSAAARPSAPGEIGVLTAAIDGMAQDLRRQERLRRDLIADVGHELRTPVTILLGELEALRDGMLPLDGEELASLQEEVQRIARLVADVDSLADAEASGFALDRAPLELAAVVADATHGFAQPFAAADLTLETSLHPVAVVADRHRIEQVVRNLLSNALRYSPPGTRVEVEVREEGPDAVLRVADRGPGFDADELPHVFERFWRGDAAAAVGGSGIGLAVVAEVVAAHGGHASAANRPGGGAVLTVRLPRAAAAVARQPITATASRRAVPPAPPGAR